MEPLPSWTAQMDQMMSACADLARMSAAYYKGLVAQGLSEQVATMLTGIYVTALLQTPRSNDTPDTE